MKQVLQNQGSSRGKGERERCFHVLKVESKGRKTRDLRKWDYKEGDQDKGNEIEDDRKRKMCV